MVYLTQLLRECRIIVRLILIRTSCKMYTGHRARVVIVFKSVNGTYFQRTARRVAPATEPLTSALDGGEWTASRLAPLKEPFVST